MVIRMFNGSTLSPTTGVHMFRCDARQGRGGLYARAQRHRSHRQGVVWGRQRGKGRGGVETHVLRLACRTVMAFHNPHAPRALRPSARALRFLQALSLPPPSLRDCCARHPAQAATLTAGAARPASPRRLGTLP